MLAQRQAAADPIGEYFKCPGELTPLHRCGRLSSDAGYFTFGGATCYGRLAGARPSDDIGRVTALSAARRCEDGRGPCLPFELAEVVTNLRQERYRRGSSHYLETITAAAAVQTAYYLFRPFLAVPIRKHLQKLRLTGWDRIAFPRWPVDVTVETLMKHAMGLILRHLGIERMPFIWFWPDGAPGCVLMTHDVEGRAGREFCDELMDLDETFGIKSAFQLVPEERGATPEALWKRIRSRGFEVNLHDLNHDGHLFRSKAEFLERAADINRYARHFECRGFRSASMYREQQWYDAFELSYDMSVPSVAHLEPQRGGCCTVMPYFVGNLLELPLTTTQDYSLFHILGDYSTALWMEQIELILANHGLVSFIAHPDYLVEARARAVYSDLLAELCRIRDDRNVWVTLPGEVDQWWRARAAMTLVRDHDSWRIEGAESDRARVAYATLRGDRVVFELEHAAAMKGWPTA